MYARPGIEDLLLTITKRPLKSDLLSSWPRNALDEHFLNQRPVPSSRSCHHYPTISHYLPMPNAQSPRPYGYTPLVFRAGLQLPNTLAVAQQ